MQSSKVKSRDQKYNPITNSSPDEVVEILSASLDTGKPGIIDLGVVGRDTGALAVSHLTKLPVELFQREQRERVLNSLLKNLFHPRTKSKMSEDSLISRICLMLKLMDAPNASATLVCYWKSQFNILG
jgi:hypothetical protein